MYMNVRVKLFRNIVHFVGKHKPSPTIIQYAKNDPNLTFFRTHLHERGSKIVAKYGLFCGSKIVFNEGWWVFAVYMRYGRRAVAPEGAVP